MQRRRGRDGRRSDIPRAQEFAKLRVPRLLSHLKECVDEEDVEDVLERDDDAVEHSLQLRNAVDCLERPEHAQQLQRLELLPRRSPPEKR